MADDNTLNSVDEAKQRYYDVARDPDIQNAFRTAKQDIGLLDVLLNAFGFNGPMERMNQNIRSQLGADDLRKLDSLRSLKDDPTLSVEDRAQIEQIRQASLQEFNDAVSPPRTPLEPGLASPYLGHDRSR